MKQENPRRKYQNTVKLLFEAKHVSAKTITHTTNYTWVGT